LAGLLSPPLVYLGVIAAFPLVWALLLTLLVLPFAWLADLGEPDHEVERTRATKRAAFFDALQASLKAQGGPTKAANDKLSSLWLKFDTMVTLTEKEVELAYEDARKNVERELDRLASVADEVVTGARVSLNDAEHDFVEARRELNQLQDLFHEEDCRRVESRLSTNDPELSEAVEEAWSAHLAEAQASVRRSVSGWPKRKERALRCIEERVNGWPTSSEVKQILGDVSLIEDADINGIGHGRRNSLARAGIVTAGDVLDPDNAQRIKRAGLPASVLSRLQKWAKNAVTLGYFSKLEYGEVSRIYDKLMGVSNDDLNKEAETIASRSFDREAVRRSLAEKLEAPSGHLLKSREARLEAAMNLAQLCEERVLQRRHEFETASAHAHRFHFKGNIHDQFVQAEIEKSIALKCGTLDGNFAAFEAEVEKFRQFISKSKKEHESASTELEKSVRAYLAS